MQIKITKISWNSYDSFNGDIGKIQANYWQKIRIFLKYLFRIILQLTSSKLIIPGKPKLIKFEPVQKNVHDCGLYSYYALDHLMNKKNINWCKSGNSNKQKKLLQTTKKINVDVSKINELRSSLTALIYSSYENEMTEYQKHTFDNKKLFQEVIEKDTYYCMDRQQDKAEVDAEITEWKYCCKITNIDGDKIFGTCITNTTKNSFSIDWNWNITKQEFITQYHFRRVMLPEDIDQIEATLAENPDEDTDKNDEEHQEENQDEDMKNNQGAPKKEKEEEKEENKNNEEHQEENQDEDVNNNDDVNNEDVKNNQDAPKKVKKEIVLKKRKLSDIINESEAEANIDNKRQKLTRDKDNERETGSGQ